MKHPEASDRARPTLCALVLCAGICLFPVTALALKSDHNQPIHIEADTVQVDEKNGTSYYQGNVHLRQGSMKVRADTILVTTQEQKVHLIKAKGDPAHFEQLPDDEPEPILATAIKIDYDATEGQLVLNQKAHLTQGSNEFSSDTIRYATKESQVIATSDANGSGRVRAVISPDKVQ